MKDCALRIVQAIKPIHNKIVSICALRIVQTIKPIHNKIVDC